MTEIKPKFRTSVDISPELRMQIQLRGMTIAGCIKKGLEAMDERLNWNADKEQELKLLKEWRSDYVKEKIKAKARALALELKNYEDGPVTQ
jgi:hypothetical protein